MRRRGGCAASSAGAGAIRHWIWSRSRSEHDTADSGAADAGPTDGISHRRNRIGESVFPGAIAYDATWCSADSTSDCGYGATDRRVATTATDDDTDPALGSTCPIALGAGILGASRGLPHTGGGGQFPGDARRAGI